MAAKENRQGDRRGRRRPPRAARYHRTDQGVPTLIAGVVALAAVAVGTVLTDGTGGGTGGGPAAVRTPVPPAPVTRISAPAAPDISDTPGAPAPAPLPSGSGRAAALSAGTAGEYAGRVVALVNTERRRAGCPLLRMDRRLRSAAQGHATDMADRDYYAHSSPEGKDAGDRLDAAGYRWRGWGENIHRGPDDPAHAVRDWMAGAEHRKNVLNCAFKDIGVGVDLSANGPWWVQDFGVRE
ncbi:CAP domain-containing protein [Streptomyces lichenis]|uniref:CAP domain-containing protein n=1 Tax=Streptomyces lichenis TaxID=2306967 RepID=A0ABT0IAF7_9ACTN|nr:CAP domain-containing protein [Streptomyces lichenis]MCK8678301.1 CAP domain-containing protein [Streptomyces lichenis]